MMEPPQGHWLRGCRDSVERWRGGVQCGRHKVIGFVDAATIGQGVNGNRDLPPQGHWLRGCRDNRRKRNPLKSWSAATRSLASWMPRRNLRHVQACRYRRPPQGHWLRGCRDLSIERYLVTSNHAATRSLASWMPRPTGGETDGLTADSATRSLASWMPRLRALSTAEACIVRHKVIGFVDAATLSWCVSPGDIAPATRSLASWMPRRKRTKANVARIRGRHKVIGFVDAATVQGSTLNFELVPRHKVIGFVDAATQYPAVPASD